MRSNNSQKNLIKIEEIKSLYKKVLNKIEQTFNNLKPLKLSQFKKIFYEQEEILKWKNDILNSIKDILKEKNIYIGNELENNPKNKNSNEPEPNNQDLNIKKEKLIKIQL